MRNFRGIRCHPIEVTSAHFGSVVAVFFFGRNMKKIRWWTWTLTDWMLHAMSGVIRRVNKRGLKAFRAAKNRLRLLRFAEVRSI